MLKVFVKFDYISTAIRLFTAKFMLTQSIQDYTLICTPNRFIGTKGERVWTEKVTYRNFQKYLSRGNWYLITC